MRKQLFIKAVILCQLIVIWGSANAQPPWQKQDGRSSDTPIIITSEKADLDNQKRVALYSGEVRVVRGEMIMTSDSLKVFFHDAEQGVKQIKANGQVKIWWKDRYAEAQEGIYDDAAQTIILSGSPKTWEGENMVKGEKIIYNLSKDKVLVEGNVETILHIGILKH